MPMPWMLPLLVVVLLAGAAPLQVAVLNTDSGLFSVWGAQTREVARFWEDYVKSIGGIGPSRQQVNITFVDVGFDRERCRNATLDILAGRYGDVRFIVGPYTSFLTEVAAIEVEKHSKPAMLVGTNAAASQLYECDTDLKEPCRVPHSRRFSRFRGVATPAPLAMRPFISLVKVKQAQTIAFVKENDQYTLDVCRGARQFADSLRLSVVLDVTLPRITDASASVGNVRAILQQLKETKPDTVIGCGYIDLCTIFIREAHALDFTAKAIAFTVCHGTPQLHALGDITKYFYFPSQWDHRLVGDSYTESAITLVKPFRQYEPGEAGATANNTLPSPMQYHLHYYDRFGRYPSYQSTIMMQAFYAIQIAITEANSTNPLQALDAYQVSFQTSFGGVISANHFGANERKETITSQIDKDLITQIVTPFDAAHGEPVYPMPTWQERVYTRKLFARSSEHAVIALVVLLSSLCLASSALVYTQRQHRLVVTAGHSHLQVMLLLAVVVCIGVLTWPVEDDDTLCAVSPWFLGVGTVAFLAGVAMNVELPSKVVRLPRHQRQTSSPPFQWGLLAALAAPAVLIALVWSVVDTPSTYVVVTDEHRPSTNVSMCTSEHWQVYVSLFLAYELGLLCYGAYKARHLAAMDRGALAIANCTACLVLAVGLSVSPSIHETPSVWFVVRSWLTLVLVAATEILLVFPLVYELASSARKRTETSESDEDLFRDTTPSASPPDVPNRIVMPKAQPGNRFVPPSSGLTYASSKSYSFNSSGSGFRRNLNDIILPSVDEEP